MIARRRMTLSQELTLALLPTAVVLGMLGAVEVFSRQRLLFASLASSAFLIYLDPEHPTNAIRTVILAQGAAAVLGFCGFWILGAGYPAAAASMIVTTFVMIALDAMHPPAVATALTFAFRASSASTLSLFGLCVLLIVLLVVLQRASRWILGRYRTDDDKKASP